MKLLKLNICAAIIVALSAAHAFSQVPVRYAVHWAPPSGPDVSRVLVYRSATDASTNFVPIGSVAVTDTSYTDADASLVSNVTYWYRLRAQNAAGAVGRFSTNAISALSISPSASPAIKAICRIDSVVTIDSNSVRVYWTTAAPTTGKLRYWRMGSGNVSETAVAATLATRHDIVIGGLSKTYVYFARAVTQDGTGRALVLSAEQSFGTAPPPPALAIVMSTDTLVVPESGTAQLGVKLNTQPAGPVSITISPAGGDPDLSLASAGVLNFTPSNWGTWQMSTFAAAADPDTQSNVANFVLGISSGGSAPAKTLTAMERDNNGVTPVLSIVVDTDTLVVPEGGTAQFHVRLDYAPATDLSVAVSRSTGDADISVQSGSTLTFTPSNWDVGQAVTLAAAPDADVSDGTAVIWLRGTSGPAVLDGFLAAREADDDELAFVLDADTLVVPEASWAQFHVRLAFQPPSDVSATVARSGGDPDLDVHAGAMLVFTPSNWNEDQTVTLTAASDQDLVDGTARIVVHAGPGPAVPDASLIAVEDDRGALYFAFDRDTIVVPEGKTATYQVKLTAAPASNVTVGVSRLIGDTDITLPPGAPVVFTPQNWSVYQTVTVAAAEDADSDDGSAILLVRSVSGASVPDAQLPAREDDNDPVGNGNHETGASGPVVAYPMPYRPENGSLHIRNVPIDGTIDLFDLAGRKIWSVSWSGRDEVAWNGVNEQASPVSSGRYFLIVKDGAGRTVEKQAILVVR